MACGVSYARRALQPRRRGLSRPGAMPGQKINCLEGQESQGPPWWVAIRKGRKYRLVGAGAHTRPRERQRPPTEICADGDR